MKDGNGNDKNHPSDSFGDLFSFKTIVKGSAKGKILFSKTPINFLGAVDKKDGTIQDANHELYGSSVRDSILVFPYGVGSSVGAYTIYSLRSNNASPKAMICSKPDITTVSGCALANIPLVVVQQGSKKDSNTGQVNDLIEQLGGFFEKNQTQSIRIDTSLDYNTVSLD